MRTIPTATAPLRRAGRTEASTALQMVLKRRRRRFPPNICEGLYRVDMQPIPTQCRSVSRGYLSKRKKDTMVSRRRSHLRASSRPRLYLVLYGCFHKIIRVHRTVCTQIMEPQVLAMSSAYAVSEATLAAETQRAGTEPEGPLDQQYKRVSPFLAPLVEDLITRPPRETYDLEASSPVQRMRLSLETCPRAHDELYLTEAVAPQRSCSNGDACQSFHMQGFALREFLLPSQHETWLQDGSLPTLPGMCLMCERNAVVASLVGCRSRRLAFQDDTLLQSFCNLTDVPGEYRHEDCVMSQRKVWEGLPSPIVLHTKSIYKPTEKYGVRGYTQTLPQVGEKRSFLSNRPDS